MNEAAPVVTGRSDAETAGIVFAGWRTNPELQERFNPFVELQAAREVRDRVLRRFLLKPGHLAQLPREEKARHRAMAAIGDILRLLATERRWGRVLIAAYLGREIPDDVWALALAEAVL